MSREVSENRRFTAFQSLWKEIPLEFHDGSKREELDIIDRVRSSLVLTVLGKIDKCRINPKQNWEKASRKNRKILLRTSRTRLLKTIREFLT